MRFLKILKKTAPPIVAQPPASGGGDHLTVPADVTLFHITHWKAGSQWLRAVLGRLFGPAVVPAEYYHRQLLGKTLPGGKFYTCVYASKPLFDSLDVAGKRRSFAVIRDLRDTLISCYFSFRNTHSIDNEMVAEYRDILTRLNKEDGVNYLMETWLGACADIQRTWLRPGNHCYRLEDCVEADAARWARIFHDSCGLAIERERLETALAECSFENLAGRKRGSEDANSHYRKGVPGDWRNHFTPALTKRFKHLFADVLIAGRYEKDADW